MKNKFEHFPLLDPDRLWGLPSLLFNWGVGAISTGVRWPVREARHSPPSSAGLKTAVLYIHFLQRCS
jgi:hypothetical protein